MVLSYVRIQCSLDDALARYGRWVGLPEVAPKRLVAERDVHDLSLVDDQWRGMAVFIYASGSWTIIEEVSGGLSTRSVKDWIDLANGGDLVFASCNDTVPYAGLVVVERGQLVRHFLDDEEDSTENVNVGRLPEEPRKGFNDWIGATSWIEEDEEKRDRPNEGWLWIHQPPQT